MEWFLTSPSGIPTSSISIPNRLLGLPKGKCRICNYCQHIPGKGGYWSTYKNETGWICNLCIREYSIQIEFDGCIWCSFKGKDSSFKCVRCQELEIGQFNWRTEHTNGI